MITRKNKKNRTAYVYDRSGSVEAVVVQSFAGAKQRNQLTIKSGKTNIVLNSRQLNTLKRVLSTANRVAANA